MRRNPAEKKLQTRTGRGIRCACRCVSLAAVCAMAAAGVASAQAGAQRALTVHAAALSEAGAGAAEMAEKADFPIGTGDFNGDGRADIVEAEPEHGRYSLRVLLGSAGGGFRSEAAYPLKDGDPRALLVGDFNGDGHADVIVGDEDGRLEEFDGDGEGHFADAGTVAQLGSVASLAAGHFTHGGPLDLVVSDYRSNSAVIFLGAGDGRFRQIWSFRLGMAGEKYHVATADFNGDGIADLVITSEDEDNNDYQVMLGNGNGTFTYAPQLSHVRDPNSYCPS